MRVLFLPKKSLIAAIKENTMLFLNYTVKKKIVKIRKKIDRQLVMSRTSLTIKHVEKGPKNTGNAPA